jgi:hypothetical protein
MRARSLVLAAALCACGARTMIDGPAPVDDGATGIATTIADSSTADSGDVDGPPLIGPSLDAAADTYVAPDVGTCVLRELDGGGNCVTSAECCYGAICLNGQCFTHTQ